MGDIFRIPKRKKGCILNYCGSDNFAKHHPLLGNLYLFSATFHLSTTDRPLNSILIHLSWTDCECPLLLLLLLLLRHFIGAGGHLLKVSKMFLGAYLNFLMDHLHLRRHIGAEKSMSGMDDDKWAVILMVVCDASVRGSCSSCWRIKCLWPQAEGGLRCMLRCYSWWPPTTTQNDRNDDDDDVDVDVADCENEKPPSIILSTAPSELNSLSVSEVATNDPQTKHSSSWALLRQVLNYISGFSLTPSLLRIRAVNSRGDEEIRESWTNT